MKRFKGWKRLVFCGLVLVVPGCGKEKFDGAKAMAETEALVKISPRDSGTAAGRRAAVLLETRLKELGLKATIDNFSEETPNGKMLFNNVLARIPGKTERMIILASHFDTKSGISDDFQGANDSGSSSGVLMELARVLAARGPYEAEFMIAFLDGEECRSAYGFHDGLHGSRQLAKQICSEGGAKFVDAVIVL
ncbi:MAG: M28 family peptidase, partial [Pontiellaceae bacterium]|nr:M28 family peptidase [Pontiellaceae bacterium]